MIRSLLPVDNRTKDWGRRVATDLNSLLRKYIWAFHVIGTPDASEVLCIHPAGASFYIPADWGERIEGGATRYAALEYSCDTMPTSSFTVTVYRKPYGETSYTQIGTWTIGTDGVMSATTTDNKPQDFAAGDVFRAVAPAVADATADNMAFTIIGFR